MLSQFHRSDRNRIRAEAEQDDRQGDVEIAMLRVIAAVNSACEFTGTLFRQFLGCEKQLQAKGVMNARQRH
jgi:hypothetical protein